jgi:hypothetical protein
VRASPRPDRLTRPARLRRLAAGLAAGAAILAAVTGCGGNSHHAAAAASSFTADPTTSADVAQAKALVTKCVTGTPLQQLNTIHLLFFESKTGKHGPQVVQTRARVFSCMGVPPAQRDNFANAALTAAEHARPALVAHHGVSDYLEVTLPGLLVKAQNGELTASGGTATPAASPTAAAPASMTPSVKASAS